MNWNLVQKYLSGTCSNTEQEKVEHWMKESPRHKRFMNSMKKVWEVEPRKQETVNVEAAWKKFKAEHLETKNGRKGVKGISVDKALQQRKRQKWYSRTSVYTAAAIIALLVVSIFLIKTYYFNPVSSKPIYHIVATNAGERSTITLSSGIKIKLNAESKLKIPIHYQSDKRVLYLKGEAFFNVKHNSSRKLLIHAGGVLIQDLGTKFDISTYGKGNYVSVVVTEGKVNVITNHKEPVSLSAQERAVVSKDKITVHSVNNLNKFISWTHNKMIFRNTPFKKVIRRLERQYNVVCRVQDPAILNQRLTATFNHASLRGVLLLIQEAMNINAKQEGRKIIFTTKYQ